MRDVLDPGEAFEKCEELFEKYGISDEDKGWFILAFESLCIKALILKGGPFYERYTTALADHALETAQEEEMIRHEQAKLAKENAEIDAILKAMRKAKGVDGQG